MNLSTWTYLHKYQVGFQGFRLRISIDCKVLQKKLKNSNPPKDLEPPLPLCEYCPDKWEVFTKVVLGFRNFGQDFCEFGEMFEGDFADSVPKISADVDGGTRDTVKHAQTGREDIQQIFRIVSSKSTGGNIPCRHTP